MESGLQSVWDWKRGSSRPITEPEELQAALLWFGFEAVQESVIRGRWVHAQYRIACRPHSAALPPCESLSWAVAEFNMREGNRRTWAHLLGWIEWVRTRDYLTPDDRSWLPWPLMAAVTGFLAWVSGLAFPFAMAAAFWLLLVALGQACELLARLGRRWRGRRRR